MNWNKLKEFCNSLDEKELNEPVILWRDDEAINFIEAKTLDEDYYIGDGDEGCYAEIDATKPLSKLKKVYNKGNAVLFEQY
jgi:hypothetical protein